MVTEPLLVVGVALVMEGGALDSALDATAYDELVPDEGALGAGEVERVVLEVGAANSRIERDDLRYVEVSSVVAADEGQISIILGCRSAGGSKGRGFSCWAS